MAINGLSGFGADGMLRLAPNDPDAAYLMAKYPGRYRFTTPQEAAPYVVQLGVEGNPFTPVAAIPGPIHDQYMNAYLSGRTIAQAAAATGIVDPLSVIPHSSGISNIESLGIGSTALAIADDPGSGFDPANVQAGVATLKAFGLMVYGSESIGNTRFSSLALENNKSGIRMGQMPRIVVPPWANRTGMPY